MSNSPNLPVVFESGVVRFDDDGTLNVHLSHGPDAPHPVNIHPDVGDTEVPGSATAVDLKGDGRQQCVGFSLPETDTLPDGLVFTFKGYSMAKVELSGDLTVVVNDPSGMPDWFVAGKVHRFDGPEDGVKIWSGSAQAPAPLPPPKRPTRPPPASAPKTAAKSTGGCALAALGVLGALAGLLLI